eukprot:g497.t1
MQRRLYSVAVKRVRVSPPSDAIASDGGFRLERGPVIPKKSLWVKYAMYTPDGFVEGIDDRSYPVVLLCPSMSNDIFPVKAEGKESQGWWQEVIGEGETFGIDLNCFRITPRDMAAAHAGLLDILNIKKVHAVVGGSMGGMQALQFAAHYPDRLLRCAAIASTGRTSPGTVALRSVQRSAIALDPAFCNGMYNAYDEDEDDKPMSLPLRGMGVARKIGTINYRSRKEFDSRFEWSFDSDRESFEVERYLEHQASKFTKVSVDDASPHYDPNCYMLLSKAMDLHDVGGSSRAADVTVDADVPKVPVGKEVMLLPYSTDVLMPPSESISLAKTWKKAGVHTKGETDADIAPSITTTSSISSGDSTSNRQYIKGSSPRHDATSMLQKKQSWLVPPEANRMVTPKARTGNTISSSALRYMGTDVDESERGQTIMTGLNSSSSLSVLSALAENEDAFSSQKRSDNIDGSPSQLVDKRFVIDSLRLRFSNDENVERAFRERFFAEQTGHRPWNSPSQCLPEIFTNIPITLICIELALVIAIAMFSKTAESEMPYFREADIGDPTLNVTCPAGQKCYVVKMRRLVSNYLITHGLIIALLSIMVVTTKVRSLRRRLMKNGAWLWQWLASATLTGSCFALLMGYFFTWGVDNFPKFCEVENVPMPLTAQAMIVQFYSLLLVFSCASGVCFWRVLWGNLIASLSLIVLQFRSDVWLREDVSSNRQGAETLYIWFLINSFLTVLSYRNELQLRVSFIQTCRLEEANMEVRVQMRSMRNPFSVARIEEYVGMREMIRDSSTGSFRGLLNHNLKESIGEWALDFHRLRFERQIARGGGGIVWRGRYFEETVAIKQVFAGRNSKEPILGGSLEAFANEVSVLHKLSTGATHPNLVRLYGICKSKSRDLYFVMEYCDCTLHDILVGEAESKMAAIEKEEDEGKDGDVEEGGRRKRKDDSATKEDSRARRMVMCGCDSPEALRTLRRCIKQTGEAMAFLHDRNVAHRDLKPQNLLVKRYAANPIQVKLADFGISRSGSRFGVTLYAGTPTFMSPELLDPDALFGGPGIDPDIVRHRPTEKRKHRQKAIPLDAAFKADVWSFGITCAAMCLKSNPWPSNIAHMTLIRRICQGEKPILPASCPDDVRNLIARCLQIDPYKRPDFASLEDSRFDLLQT